MRKEPAKCWFFAHHRHRDTQQDAIPDRLEGAGEAMPARVDHPPESLPYHGEQADPARQLRAGGKSSDTLELKCAEKDGQFGLRWSAGSHAFAPLENLLDRPVEHTLHQRSTNFVDRSEMMQDRAMSNPGLGRDINEHEGLRE